MIAEAAIVPRSNCIDAPRRSSPHQMRTRRAAVTVNSGHDAAARRITQKPFMQISSTGRLLAP